MPPIAVPPSAALGVVEVDADVLQLVLGTTSLVTAARQSSLNPLGGSGSRLSGSPAARPACPRSPPSGRGWWRWSRPPGPCWSSLCLWGYIVQLDRVHLSITRSMGRAAPLLLTPAEGRGSFRSPRSTVGGLRPPWGLRPQPLGTQRWLRTAYAQGVSDGFGDGFGGRRKKDKRATGILRV